MNTGEEYFLDARQQRIARALEERRPELASMYKAALNLLKDPPPSLNGRTRVSYICHSMREVMNRVLGAMGRPTTPVFKPTSSDQIKRLPDILSRFPTLDLDGGGDLVPVPREIASVMSSLFRAAVHEKRRVRGDIAALLTDDDNEAHAAVGHWMNARNFFVQWAHLFNYEVPESKLPSNEDMSAQISVFDELFDGVITAFFTRRHSIDDLLAEINSMEERNDE